MPLYKNKNLYIIFANTLVGIVSVSLIVPALPEIARHFSLSPQGVSIIIASYTLPGALMGIFLGIIADKIGRKALLIPSLMIFGIFGGLIYWINDYFWINIMRLAQGVGGAVLPSISTILIGDLFAEEQRLKVMGLNAAVLGIGTALFPFIGGILASFSWNTPFLFFWLAIPLAIFAAIHLKEPEFENSQSMNVYIKESIRYLLSPGALLIFGMGLMVFILLYGGILTYLTLYMDRHFSMNTFAIGTLIATASFATAGIAPLAHRIELAMGRRKMLVAGFTLFFVSFLSMPIASSKLLLLVSVILFGAAMGLTVPLFQNMVTELSPMKYRGFMVSIFATTIRLGQTIGPPLLGLILYIGELKHIFMLCGMSSFFFVALLFLKGSILEKK